MSHPLLATLEDPAFTARDVATLLFVVRAGEALLIRKKRGLGAGKVNAPGGRLEPGESPRDAAVREVQEELRVTPEDVVHRGELRFAFTDGYTLHCHVFTADRCVGEPQETDEAVPLWRPLEALPYDEMWADDARWLPRVLAGYRAVDGRFVFDGDALLAERLAYEDPAAPLFALFDELGVRVHVRSHPPVFTVAQAQRHRPAGERGMHVKNLFVRDRKGRAWLLTAPEEKPLELKAIAKLVGASGGLTFATPARLRAALGVEPGSVTPLAAVNDPAGAVQVVLDAALLDAELLHCHPLTNDRTVALTPAELRRVLAKTGHDAQVLAL